MRGKKISVFVMLLWLLFSPAGALAFEKGLLKTLGFQEIMGDIQAPDFSLSSLEGKKVSLKDLKGSVVFLHFWATWCKPCEEEFPAIERVHRDYKERGFKVIAVSIDKGAKGIVEDFADRMGISFTVLLSTEGTISESYWTWGVPTSFIIDRKGRIIGRALGPRAWDSPEARALFEAALRD